jgi:hypothetical protein
MSQEKSASGMMSRSCDASAASIVFLSLILCSKTALNDMHGL